MAEYLGDGMINLKVEIDDALKFFDGLNVNKTTIARGLLNTVGAGGKSRIKRNYPALLHKRSGLLYKSIKYTTYRNGTKVIFTNTADSGKRTSKDGRTARYGFMLASGYTITAKSGYLTFNINGKWVKKKSVTVASRDYMEEPVLRYMDSGELNRNLDATFQKQVDRLEKKMGVSLK